MSSSAQLRQPRQHAAHLHWVRYDILRTRLLRSLAGDVQRDGAWVARTQRDERILVGGVISRIEDRCPGPKTSETLDQRNGGRSLVDGDGRSQLQDFFPGHHD